MARDVETDVLVVGAGPVGMLAALLLAEKGVQVRIIDKEQRTTTHSYACVLHPETLRILGRAGLAQEVAARGRRIDTIGLYEGEARRAELKFSELAGEYPFAVVVPQGAFEDLLEEKLQTLGVNILWNHRLSEMKVARDEVVASIDKLTQSAKGYIVPEWDWTVAKTLETSADFIVGADGHDSMVRARLGAECEAAGEPELFAVFEFQTAADPGSEVRIALDESTVNVLWPLPGNGARWSFQLVKTKKLGEFPSKGRESGRISMQAVDPETRARVELLARQRAPWFKESIKDFYWWAHIRFEPRLARQFGKDRVWLAGDAAHQTGPVGVQSMNAGLSEAEDVAGKLAQILRDGAPMSILEEYGRTRHAQWKRLLSHDGALRSQAGAAGWVSTHAGKLLPCIPALGDDLTKLASQLRLAY